MSTAGNRLLQARRTVTAAMCVSTDAQTGQQQLPPSLKSSLGASSASAGKGATLTETPGRGCPTEPGRLSPAYHLMSARTVLQLQP